MGGWGGTRDYWNLRLENQTSHRGCPAGLLKFLNTILSLKAMCKYFWNVFKFQIFASEMLNIQCDITRTICYATVQRFLVWLMKMLIIKMFETPMKKQRMQTVHWFRQLILGKICGVTWRFKNIIDGFTTFNVTGHKFSSRDLTFLWVLTL